LVPVPKCGAELFGHFGSSLIVPKLNLLDPKCVDNTNRIHRLTGRLTIAQMSTHQSYIGETIAAHNI